MTGPSVMAVVREWHDDEGWGVVDAPEVPGGCWVSFAQVRIPGYRTLHPGQPVSLEWEPANQDGFAYRAHRVWPWNTDPTDDPHPSPDSGAYTSTLTLTFDPSAGDSGHPDRHQDSR